MKMKFLAVGIAAMMTAGVACAQLSAFKVNGDTVSVAQQKALYDAAVKQGRPAGAELEQMVKNMMIERTVLLQEAKKAKVEGQTEVKEALAQARDNILIQAVQMDWAKKNKPSEDELKAAYQRQKDLYGKTEFEVAQIIVKTEDQAKNLISRLEKGSDFAKLASESSLDTKTKAKGGVLGWVPQGELPPAVYALKDGQVAKTPVQTPAGYAVLKVNKTRPAQNFPKYEDAKPRLTDMLVQDKLNQHFGTLIQKAKIQ